MQANSVKNLGAKNFPYDIVLMKWNSLTDLIAYANSRGEVIVQRLNWQNLLVQPPPDENVRVGAMDWHPQEKVLSVGYSNGTVIQIDVENQCECNTLQLESEVACLAWTRNRKPFLDESKESEDIRLHGDAHETYLPSLPSFESLSSNTKRSDYESFKPYETKIFNILIVGLKNGVVQLFVYGVMSCGRFEITKHLNIKENEVEIIDAKLSADFHQTFVMVKLKNRLRTLIFENDIFPKYIQPLSRLAKKNGYIFSVMEYIADIIESMTQAWESALLDMDDKLTNYVDSQPENTVSADFLELLMFGFPSPSLEQFLTRELTDKGLKKLGNSIEVSYSTIQQLIVKPLHTGIVHIVFHLTDVRGMSLNDFSFKPILGRPSNEALQNAGALLIKSLEVEQAIQQSTRDYKIFWGWLYGVIIRLMGESVPDDVAAVTQQDIMYLADFLKTFDQKDDEDDENPLRRRKFNLERVGQYLQNRDLQILPKKSLTAEWCKLLDQNGCLKESDVIYPHHKELSLVQEHKLLQKSIKELFSIPGALISEHFKFKKCIDLDELTDIKQVSLHQMNVQERYQTVFCATVSNESMYFLIFTIKSEFVKLAKFQFTQKPQSDTRFNMVQKLKFRHNQFYNQITLSMLLDNIDGNIVNKFYTQIPIQNIESRLVSVKMFDYTEAGKTLIPINFYDVIDPTLLIALETSDGHIISVCGGRKTASILSDNCKRVRHYDLDAEEEEEEDDDTSASLDTSKE